VTISQLRDRVAATLAVTLMLGLAADAPAGAQAAPARKAAPALQIVSPRPGAVVGTASRRAARSAVLRARVRAGRGLRRVALRLNGRTVTPRRGAGRILVARLSAANGLRPGGNRLRVEAMPRGAKVPVNAVSPFTVTYPNARLIRLGSDSTRGGQAAVIPRLRVPASGVSAASVTLNGRDVGDALSPRLGAGGSRRLELSAANGLRWRGNALTVRVVMNDGRAQTVRKRFALDARRNLAGLRLRGAADVGRLVHLDGGSSRVVKGRLDRTALRWSLRRRPAGSHSRIAARGSRAAFKPDIPGRYRVRLTVGSGATEGSATLTVTATYSSLLVPLESIDDGSPPALSIGGTRYPVSPCPRCVPAPVYNGLQVHVFDRATLEPLDEQGFDTSSSAISALGTYLKGLPNADLVFVTHPSATPSIAASDRAALNTALGYIGGSYPGFWQLDQTCWAGQTDVCNSNTSVKTGWVDRTTAAVGSFSVAGVPGMSAGQAWRASAVQSRTREGNISGYLTRGVPAQTGGVNSYVIVAGADQFAQVDTCASGGPSQCVIQVGDQTFAPDPGVVNGFNVVTLDRTTLAPINHATVTSVGQMESVVAYEPSGHLQAGRQLTPNSLDDQKVLIVQSIGNGSLTSAGTDTMYPYIDWFGGTPELFKAAIPGGVPYAMVGVADDPPWHGTARESSPAVVIGTQVAGLQTGRLRAVLSRNRDWLFTPAAGDPYGQTNLDLFSVMYQDPTPWSYVGDPAVAYIGAELSLPADVRSAYTNANVDFASKAAILASLTCTDTAACGSNFDAVKKQLLNEFDWVESARSLIANLQYPFVVDQQSQPLNVEDVYNEISATVKPPPTKGTSFDFLTMFLDVANLAESVAFAAGEDDAGQALGLVASSGQFAADTTSDTDGDSADTVDGEVQQLDEQLASEQISYVEALDNLGALLVTDAGKLQTVGVSVGTDPTWSWNEGTSLSESITALNATSRASSYAALLPPTWGVWNLKGAGQSPPSSDDVKKYVCAGWSSGPVAIWANTAAGNQMHGVYSTDTTEVWTFSNLYNLSNGGFSDAPYKNVTIPSQSLTDNINSTNTLSGAFQYLPQWVRSTYNPPAGVDCTYVPGYPSVAWTPPVIPHADTARTQ
jgi:hypothetical protein